MNYKYNFMMHPLMTLTRRLLSYWKQSTNGKDAKYYTNAYVSSIYKLGGAVASTKDALRTFHKKDNK